MHCRNKHHKQAQKRFFKGSFKPNGWMREISLSEEDGVGGGGGVLQTRGTKTLFTFLQAFIYLFFRWCASQLANICHSLERNV